MRNYVLKQYMNLSQESVIIGHHGSIHLKNFFITVALTAFLWLLYTISQYFFPSILIITRILAGLMIIIYINFILQFLNNYLDAIVINKQGVSIFERNKILNYSLRYCHRDHIESINQSQVSLGDRIFDKGQIDIGLNHGTIEKFRDIGRPKYVSSFLWDKKSQFESKIYNNNSMEQSPFSGGLGNEKFDILVETLGEVIKEYMDKDKSKNSPPDRRNM